MYLTITAEGHIEQHDGVPTSEDISEFVGGYFEVKTLNRENDLATIWMGEKAKDDRLPVNAKATRWAHDFEGIRRDDFIAGPVVLTGGASEEGDTLSLPESWLMYALDGAAPVVEPA